MFIVEKIKDFLEKETLIWGPLFLLPVLFFSASTPLFPEFSLLVLAGFFLSSLFQIRGFCYSLCLLGLFMIIRHLFVSQTPLQELALEGMTAVSFLLIALSFEEKQEETDKNLQTQELLKQRETHLEEELVNTKEMVQQEQILASEKHFELQKELEELQKEHSCILMLNEVLRKTSKEHLLKEKEAAEALLDLERRQEFLQVEKSSLEKELKRCKDEAPLAQENQELMKEINQIRSDREQSLLTQECLLRQHSKEKIERKELLAEIDDLKAQLRATHQQIQKDLKSEIAKELEFAEKKMVHLSQIEPLFKQLKKQFEEKKKLLSETRADLFKKETRLQALEIEKRDFDLISLPKEFLEELDTYQKQIHLLEEENQQLRKILRSALFPFHQRQIISRQAPDLDYKPCLHALRSEDLPPIQ